ncbi:MAG: hypothetical protein U1C49_01790 [Candidatus Andersenbacteria bacterium]|nr:hypothetical protein [bacterium]MDZ4225558.1 hypothetical protein [Candidatus Andersenbacteria bacterium]
MAIKEKILVLTYDCDGVLAEDLAHTYFAWAKQLGYNWNFGKVVETGNWQLATGLEQDELTKIYNTFRREITPTDQPIAGAREAIAATNGRSKHIVSLRGLALLNDTRRFLEDKIGLFHGYHFEEADKAGKIASIGGISFVEDSLKLSLAVAAQTTAWTFLFPVRGFSRSVTSRGRLIVLAAEKLAGNVTDDKSWQQLCRQAWQEITAIQSDLLPV